VAAEVVLSRRRQIQGERRVLCSRPGLLLAAAVVAGIQAPFFSAPTSAEDIQHQRVEEGRAMVTANCARCHATGMTDQSPHAKAPPFRLVVERYPSENLAEALAEGIVAGHPDMPVWILKPDQIEAFLAYLDSLKK
jgi:cytochrome c